MTSKRNSRIFDDDRPQKTQGQSSAMPCLDASRRTSRTSSIEDMHSALSNSLETNQSSTLPSKYETSSLAYTDYDWSYEKAANDAAADLERSSFASSSLPSSGTSVSSMSTDDGRLHNFGVVLPGVYRSSYPLAEHFDFCKTLGLRTVVTLVNKQDERSVNLGSFVQDNGIRHVIFSMQGTKKEDIPLQTMQSILGIVLDKSCYPLLVHCNQGKHRTGCVVAAARKVAGWPVDSVLQEYRTFAEPKVRECDVAYISALEVTTLRATSSEPSAPVWTSSCISPPRRRNFLHFIVFTVGTMMLFLCSTWHWGPQ